MKTLSMNFLNEDGKKASIRVTNVKDEVKEAEVKAVMELIVAKNIFTSKGGDLKVVDSAHVVSRETEKLEVK